MPRQSLRPHRLALSLLAAGALLSSGCMSQSVAPKKGAVSEAPEPALLAPRIGNTAAPGKEPVADVAQDQAQGAASGPRVFASPLNRQPAADAPVLPVETRTLRSDPASPEPPEAKVPDPAEIDAAHVPDPAELDQ